MKKMPESALEFNFRTRVTTSLPESILQYKRKLREVLLFPIF